MKIWIDGTEYTDPQAAIEALEKAKAEAEAEEWPYTWTNRDGDARRANTDASEVQCWFLGKWIEMDPTSFRAGLRTGQQQAVELARHITKVCAIDDPCTSYVKARALAASILDAQKGKVQDAS